MVGAGGLAPHLIAAHRAVHGDPAVVGPAHPARLGLGPGGEHVDEWLPGVALLEDLLEVRLLRHPRVDGREDAAVGDELRLRLHQGALDVRVTRKEQP